MVEILKGWCTAEILKGLTFQWSKGPSLGSDDWPSLEMLDLNFHISADVIYVMTNTYMFLGSHDIFWMQCRIFMCSLTAF